MDAMSELQTLPQRASGLLCHRLSVSRGGKPVLKGVTMDVRPGEVLGLLGANGAGKSTLLASLAGELPIDPLMHRQCPVLINGKELVHLRPAALARVRAVLPQKPGLIFDLSVEEVIGMGLYPFPELEQLACEEILRSAIEQADAEPLWHRRYPELSGGEQQRVQFARTLVQLLAGARLGKEPVYLLLDEPSSSLDPAHQHGLLRAARRAATEIGAGVLVVLHDVNVAALYCDHLAMMAEGVIVACDTPPKVLQTALLKQVYGTETVVQAHPVHANVPLVVFL